VRILIFNWKDLAHPAAGGAEVFTEKVARALVARGHTVTLFAAAVEGRPPSEIVEGVELIRDGGSLGVYRAARRFWSRSPWNAFDVVVDEINTRPFMTPRWIRDTPIVALIHQLAREIWFHETPLPISILGRYILEPWWLRAYRDVPAMTVSPSSADSLSRHHGWQRVVVVPEGSDQHPVPAVAKASQPTIVFVGRLVAMKRPQHAIDAFGLVKQLLPAAQLWIIGEGRLLGRLRESAPPGVVFGRLPRAELLDRLARAHVLVATSVREGWGLGVSEAAACGTPSIAYAVPGLVDSVEASGGALVDDTPEALGRALVDFFLGNVQLAPRPSTVSWTKVAEVMESVLSTACSAHAGRPSVSAHALP
jgi:glycosyltransferase involved in cell wall biosynthesis